MRSVVWFFIVILLSSAAYYYSYDFNTIWWLMWLAPIPLLLYLYQAKWWQVAITAFIIGAATQLSTLVGYWGSSMPWTANAESMIYGGLQFLLVFTLLFYWQQRITRYYAIFLFPLLMCLSEWGLSLTSLGTYQTVAYNQLLFLPVVQIASLGGYIAITFVLSLFASTLSYFLIHYQQRRQAFLALLLGFGIIALVLLFGIVRLHITKPQGHIKVGLVNISFPTAKTMNPKNANFIITRYERAFDKLVKRGAEFIMVPEESILVTANIQAQIKQRLANYAKQHHVYLIFGVRLKLEKTYNVAWLFNPNGTLFAEYTKRHLIPNFEDKIITSKKTLTEFTYHNYKLAIEICRDMDYTKPAAIYGENGVNVVFAPAWDFNNDAWSHGKLAYMRGVEYGYTVVRVARDGYLSVSTKTGEFIAKKYAGGRKPTALIINTPVAQSGSLYAKHRYWFLILLVVTLLILLKKTLHIRNDKK